mgnify:CR=1 FL=1
MKILNGSRYHYNALIAGAGKDLPQLLQKIEHLPFISYVGEVTDMVNFYKQIDCLVMPSHYEPMGLVQIEAQAIGVPVIASNLESLTETLTHNHNAILIPVQCPSAIAQAVIECTENSALRNKLVENGKINGRQYSYHTWNDKITSLHKIVL